MTRYVAELVLMHPGERGFLEPPEGCDQYPITCEPVSVGGPLGQAVYLALVWRETPPPIPTAPPKPKKAKL